MVSPPALNSFKHIAHIGFDQTKGTIEASKNLDQTYRDVLADLRIQTASDVTEKVIFEHDLFQSFWKGSKEPNQPTSTR